MADLLILISLLICAGVYWRIHRAYIWLRLGVHSLPPENELPSVTVCIPARNEIHSMTRCLDRVVASDYPKLEIIVCDDESHDETSILIKSYASSGVRFIEGKKLPEGWLGKNHAQNVLAHEASGTFVFFMDVDTMIQPQTISKLVAYMLSKKADMVSVIPLRDDTWRASAAFSTLRHFWTMVRFSAKKPRAASNAWLIRRAILLEQFEANKELPMSVQVETTLARLLAKTGIYRLLVSDETLGLSYEKKWKSQCETSVRLLYPQVGNFFSALLVVAVLIALLLPYVFLFTEFGLWASIAIGAQYAVYRYYLSKVRTGHAWIMATLLPIIIVQEIALMIISVYRYKTGTITWKGRPVQVSAK